MNDRPDYGAFVNLPEWDGRARELTEVWTLRKGAHTAVCALVTHPIGGEVRLTVDGDMHRTEAKRDGLALIDLALNWKQQFEAKGWRA